MILILFVAVNKYPEPDIFNVSNWGIIDDYRSMVPVRIEKFKNHSPGLINSV
ncbi:hypothetical protein N9174_01225 [bacterium]|nr:hypothetical protein [bacterium]